MRGDDLKKVEEVTERLNNMCTMVWDIMSSVAQVAGHDGARYCGENVTTTSDLDRPRVVLGEGLKDIHGQQYWSDDLCRRACSDMTTHG